MLNYEGIARIAAKEIIDDMKRKMLDGNYCIHRAVITIDLESETMKVETMRKDPVGIEFKASVEASIKRKN